MTYRHDTKGTSGWKCFKLEISFEGSTIKESVLGPILLLIYINHVEEMKTRKQLQFCG